MKRLVIIIIASLSFVGCKSSSSGGESIPGAQGVFFSISPNVCTELTGYFATVKYVPDAESVFLYVNMDNCYLDLIQTQMSEGNDPSNIPADVYGTLGFIEYLYELNHDGKAVVRWIESI